MVKAALKSLAHTIAPGVMNARYLKRATPQEREIMFLPALVPEGGTVVDVGANRGLFVHHCLKRHAKITAFEPFPAMIAWLRRNYGGRITIEEFALSNHEGKEEMRNPAGNDAWATIEESNALELATAPINHFSIRLRTLDGYAFDNIDFMKIDVEGHEEAVLGGAKATLARAKPNLLIEIEERHKPGATARVPQFLAGLGYDGFFLDGNTLRSVLEFDPARDQAKENISSEGKHGRYLNNFVFTARPGVADALRAML